MLQRKTAFAMALAMSANAYAAGDADLAAIRAQIEQIKQNYESRIAALEQKLAEAESKSTPVAAAQIVPAAQAGARAGSFNPELSFILQGQYKQMKEIPGRTISGFMPAPHENADGGIEENNQRGFSLDETELTLAANVDPYWRGQTTVALADGDAEVEEAWFQSLGLDHGLTLKAGRLFSGIGYLNDQHSHQWDFADAPLMYQALFGPHGNYAQDGLQLKWLAPTPIFLEFGAELGRGATFPGADGNQNGAGSAALFAHVGDDVGIANSWRAGLSWLHTKADDREAHMDDINGVEALTRFSGKSDTWIADFVWKWAPNGNPKEQNFKFQTEYFQRKEAGDLDCDDADPANPTACSGGASSDYDTRQTGWYAQGTYQFTRNWRAGLRFDRLDSGTRAFGANAANLDVVGYNPQRLTAMIDYNWSEFSRLRLQAAHDESMQGADDDQFTVQYIMSLGAHGAHKF